MNNRSLLRALAIAALVVAGAAAIGIGAYNAGVAQGFAESGRTIAAPPSGTSYVYVSPRPWGFGYFPIFPLFFLLILFFGIRGLLWRSWPAAVAADITACHLDSTSGTDGRMRTSVHPRRRRETRHSHERDPGRGRRATDCRNLPGLSGACRFQGDHRRQRRRRIVACPQQAAGPRRPRPRIAEHRRT